MTHPGGGDDSNAYRGHSRGQLITIAAFSLAVVFVGFAVLVNTVIFTENLATRANAETVDGVEYRAETRAAVTDMLHSANYGTEDVAYSSRVSAIESNVSTWQQQRRHYQISKSAYTSGAVSGTSEGVRVTQQSPRELDPADSDIIYELNPLGLTGQNWLVAKSVQTRQFHIRLHRTDLTIGNETGLLELLVDPGDALLDPDETFSVHFTDDEGDQWRVFVYRSEDDTDVVNVTVAANTEGSWDTVGTCSRTAPNVTVGITNETLAGGGSSESCPALGFVEDVDPPYDVYYVNGDDVEGTYEFIADEPRDVFLDEIEAANQGLLDALVGGLGITDILETHVYNSPTDDPYTTTAVYQAHVRVVYETPQIRYTSVIDLAPGEPEYESG